MKAEMPHVLARAATPPADVHELGDAPSLPRFAPAMAQAFALLYSGCAPLPVTVRDEAWRLRFVLRHRPVPPMDAYRFALGPHAGAMAVDLPAAARIVGEPRADGLPPALRCLLWADALQPMSQAIERATRLRFEWTLPAADGETRFDPRRALCFELDAPDGALHEGFLQLDDPAGVHALLQAVTLPRAAPSRTLDGLRLPLRWRIGTTRLALREMADVRAGDIVGIERWHPSGDGVGLSADLGAAGLQLLARAEGERITIVETRILPMNTDTAAADEAATLPLERLDGLEVDLRFEVGELSLTLGELKRIQPGHVLELGQPLNRTPVRILAHGNVLGKGHLVAVGDRLGVRVAEFAPGDL